MRSARERLTVITLTLAAATPLRAAQVADSSQAPPPSREAADTASSHAAHHHHDGGGKHGGGKHGGEKHGGGRKWLSFNAATNTVTFKLVAGRPRGSSRLNFNGYANGTATLVVPAKSRLVMHFVNEDSVPHSAAIVADREPVAAGLEPAFPQAATRELARGLPLHGTDIMRFTAPASGSYRIASGVPGQARSGMWIRLRVDPTAKAPAWQKQR